MSRVGMHSIELHMPGQSTSRNFLTDWKQSVIISVPLKYRYWLFNAIKAVK